MFAKLKKKVEDLEGSDLHKLATSISNSSNLLAEKTLSLASVMSSEDLSAAEPSLSAKGSTNSLSSMGTVKLDESEIIKIENKWKHKLTDLENEWKVKVIMHEHEKKELIKERETMILHTNKLENELKDLKGYQEKYLKAQKEVEKLGDIQKVLESKILGHDILREEIQLEKEKNKMLENQLQSRERSDIHKEELEEELSNINAKLKDTIEALGQANKMNDTLENKVSTLSDEKNTSLVRNAELSQQTSLCQQQLLRREEELKDHIERSNAIQEENKQFKLLLSDSETCDRNQDRERLVQLEAAFAEKNKTIKLQQQRLSDMKKTLQKELKNQATHDGEISSVHSSTPAISGAANSDLDQVNFVYLKHVIFKFLTSREYEAQHLTRAVSTLLKLSTEEENLLKETLEWKMSWFRSRPDLGSGQTAMYIPPTH